MITTFFLVPWKFNTVADVLVFFPSEYLFLGKLAVTKRRTGLVLSWFVAYLYHIKFIWVSFLKNPGFAIEFYFTINTSNIQAQKYTGLPPIKSIYKQQMTYYNVLIRIYKWHSGFNYRKSLRTSKAFTGTLASLQPTK